MRSPSCPRISKRPLRACSTSTRSSPPVGGVGTGFRSSAHVLSWRVGIALGAARERVRVARALSSRPLLGEALAKGELSYAKVRALTRIATPETETQLVKVGRAGT